MRERALRVESLQESIVNAVTTFLNYLLSYTPESINYWNEVGAPRFPHPQAFIPSVFAKFPEATELLPYACNPWELLTALVHQCGVSLELTGQERLFQNCLPFEETQVKGVPVRVKVLLPPAACCDGALTMAEAWGFSPALRTRLPGLRARDAKTVEKTSTYLSTSAQLLTALASPLVPSAFYYQAQFFFNQADVQQALVAATASINGALLYDSSFIRSLSLLFAANTDPLSLIRDINDIIARYCGTSSFIIPQLVFSVGLLAYSQDPSLGMEYISRAVTLAREIIGEDHIVTARIQEEVGDVRAARRCHA